MKLFGELARFWGIINPLRMRSRVTVLVLCVCVCQGTGIRTSGGFRGVGGVQMNPSLKLIIVTLL